jgi:allophanate hydrolase subunit 2
VSSKLDRIGVRFEGPALTRSVTRTLPSEGLIRGAVQLPPSGDPIVLLADHPTTRGYPVIAVVDDATTDLLAQVTPGQSVRFIDAAS